MINPLNAKLNPIFHFLALLGAHHILHVSRIRDKTRLIGGEMKTMYVILVGIHVALMTRSIFFCSYLPDRLHGVATQKTAIRKRNYNLEDLTIDGMIIFKGLRREGQVNGHSRKAI